MFWWGREGGGSSGWQWHATQRDDKEGNGGCV